MTLRSVLEIKKSFYFYPSENPFCNNSLDASMKRSMAQDAYYLEGTNLTSLRFYSSFLQILCLNPKY